MVTNKTEFIKKLQELGFTKKVAIKMAKSLKHMKRKFSVQEEYNDKLDNIFKINDE